MEGKHSTLYCHGGSGTVTGANFVLETRDYRIMVDCGLEQGTRNADAKRDAFPYDPSTIDVLLVTHAHMDHIGRIPLLVKKGFRGAIYSTPATRELAALMFDDALSVMAQEEKEKAIAPLYAQKDVERALLLWQTRDYHRSFMIGRDDIRVNFLDAGHVLGSAMIELTRGGRTIVFTGDLGNSPSPLLSDREQLPTTHYLVMESVYGDRLHEGKEERREKLREHIERTRAEGGVLLIPAFSLERTQVLLSEIKELIEEEGMEPIKIFLDSPLAIRITDVYRRFVKDMNEGTKQDAQGGDPFEFDGLTVAERQQDSLQALKAERPKIIIAGSGMSLGGRILFHEKEFLGDKKTTILFVGYQSVGTLGRRIQEGQKKVKIEDTWVRVRARVATLHGYSAHADRDALLETVASAAESLERVFVAMGEPHSAMFLAQRIHDYLGVKAVAPNSGDSFKLEW